MSYDSQPDKRLIKSYVWHGDRCFFVSTVDRDSSSDHGGRFSETMVFEFDWETGKRGAIVGQDGGGQGSIFKHIKMCERIFKTGHTEEQEP